MRPEFGSFHVKHGVTIWWRFFLLRLVNDCTRVVRWIRDAYVRMDLLTVCVGRAILPALVGEEWLEYQQ